MINNTKELIEEIRALEIFMPSGWAVRSENIVEILNSHSERIDTALALLDYMEKLPEFVIDGCYVLWDEECECYSVETHKLFTDEGEIKNDLSFTEVVRFITQQPTTLSVNNIEEGEE